MDKLNALKTLQTYIVIQKFDEGNSIFIVNKDNYIRKIQSSIQESLKKLIYQLKRKSEEEVETLNTLIDMSISFSTCNNLSPTRSKPGTMYGLTKVHKKSTGGSPPFRASISAIGAPTYKLLKC